MQKWITSLPPLPLVLKNIIIPLKKSPISHRIGRWLSISSNLLRVVVKHIMVLVVITRAFNLTIRQFHSEDTFHIAFKQL